MTVRKKLPRHVCPHCNSAAGMERDEHGRAYCQDCDRPRDEFRAMPFDGRICPLKPQNVAADVARDREAYRGGPRVL